MDELHRGSRVRRWEYCIGLVHDVDVIKRKGRCRGGGAVLDFPIAKLESSLGGCR